MGVVCSIFGRTIFSKYGVDLQTQLRQETALFPIPNGLGSEQWKATNETLSTANTDAQYHNIASAAVKEEYEALSSRTQSTSPTLKSRWATFNKSEFCLECNDGTTKWTPRCFDMTNFTHGQHPRTKHSSALLKLNDEQWWKVRYSLRTIYGYTVNGFILIHRFT